MLSGKYIPNDSVVMPKKGRAALSLGQVQRNRQPQSQARLIGRCPAHPTHESPNNGPVLIAFHN